MMQNIKIWVPLLWCLCLWAEVSAQRVALPLNQQYNYYLESLINQSETPYHTGAKPYLHQQIDNDELRDYNADNRKYYYWLGEKIFRGHLGKVEGKDFAFYINPLFNFEGGIDLQDTATRLLYKNTRGVEVFGHVGKRLSFTSNFYENQAEVPIYLTDYTLQQKSFPGQGRVKTLTDDSAGFDFSNSTGYISFVAANWLTIDFGADKNFIGDGYRSLLLSDFSFNYNQTRLHWRFGKGRFEYTNIFANLLTLEREPQFSTPEALFKKKGGSFHYLSANLSKKIQVGLFEGTVWKRTGDNGQTPFNYAQLIPVLGVNTGLQGFDGVNNVVAGLNLKYRFKSNMYLYGQLMVDDPNTDRLGYQVGLKGFDLFKIKRLTAQAEFNSVAAYAYSHRLPRQNYAHHNEAIAHPLGANFNEVVGLVDYQWKRLFINAKVNYATFGTENDTIRNGTSIFAEDQTPTSEVLQDSKLVFIDAKFGYKMNRHTHMRVYLGVTQRDLTSPLGNEGTTYIYLGFRTNLRNDYYDF